MQAQRARPEPGNYQRVTGATELGNNPMAQALRELRQQIVKPRKGAALIRGRTSTMAYGEARAARRAAITPKRANTASMARRFPRVPKDKAGLARKYVAGSRSPSAKAKEIKRTAKAYKEGLIDVKAVSASRTAQAKRKKKRGKS